MAEGGLISRCNFDAPMASDLLPNFRCWWEADQPLLGNDCEKQSSVETMTQGLNPRLRMLLGLRTYGRENHKIDV
ncbi:hypothetical protein ACVKSY_001476 [Sphingomonas sp. PvP107]